MIFSVIFLNILMHALADTGMEFIKYNNRALTSISVLTAFIIILSFKFIKNNFKKHFLDMSFILFIILISNFLFFQHNLIKERFNAIEFKNEVESLTKPDSLNNQKFEIDSDYHTIVFIISDREKIYELMSYNSYDFTINNMNPSITYVEINVDKYCNDNFYQPYIKKAYIDKNSQFIVFRHNQRRFSKNQPEYQEGTRFYKGSEAKKEVEDNFGRKFNCKKKRTINNNKIKEGQNIHLGDRYDSLFIRAMGYIYNRVVQ